MLSKPYSLLIFMALLLFVSSFIVSDRTVDIHLYDTYFVFDFAFVFWSLSLILFIYWLIYIVTKQVLYSRFLSWTHIATTILAVVVIVTSSIWGEYVSMPVKGSISFQDFKRYQRVSNIITLNILSLILSQILYIVNLVVGLVRKMMNSR